jgi:GTP-binding protein
MFIDCIKLTLNAGRGGHGIIAWRREKYIPKGGPDGGNGGTGGSVILKVDSSLLSLEKFRKKRFYKARNGENGSSANKQGRSGEDLILSVPKGTLVKDAQTGFVLHDLCEDDQEITLCQGGKGGLGNTFFKSPTNRAPNCCSEGKKGESIEVELELKIVADAGLVGFPSAGKSTLLGALTRAKPKAAPYSFTTLSPNLGFIEYPDYCRVLLADIPGIISGAHLNKGLGITFLKHIERTNVLIFVLNASGLESRGPLEEFHILRTELTHYSAEFNNKPCMVVLNKIDLPEAKEQAEEFKNHWQRKFPIVEISALNREGINSLLKTLYELMPVLNYA